MRWLDINCLPIPVYFDIKIYLLLIHMYISSIYLVINIDLFWLLIVLSSWTTVNWWYMYSVLLFSHKLTCNFIFIFVSFFVNIYLKNASALCRCVNICPRIQVHSNSVTTYGKLNHISMTCPKPFLEQLLGFPSIGFIGKTRKYTTSTFRSFAKERCSYTKYMYI